MSAASTNLGARVFLSATCYEVLGEMSTTRRAFVGGAAAFGALCATGAYAATGAGKGERLKVRFLGTGAADWHGRDRRGELRRLTSILVDGRILIDFTSSDRDMLPQGCRPEAVFYTHSHEDHYDPAAAIALGIGHETNGGVTTLEIAKDELPPGQSLTFAVRPLTSLGTAGRPIMMDFKV